MAAYVGAFSACLICRRIEPKIHPAPTRTASTPMTAPTRGLAIAPVWGAVPCLGVADGEAGGPSKVRAFVALEVPEPQRGTLARHLDLCRAAAPDFRWVRPESLHLTLRFLGGVSPELLDGLRDGLRRLSGRAFGLALDGVGTFGGRSAPRVVWIGVREGTEPAAELARRVEALCQAAG